jgi:drug/metabolite transporter (DMT)-like permease
MRWQSQFLPSLEGDLLDKILEITFFLFRPWVLSAILATLFAGISWMFALAKLEISYAYAFISLNYLLITILGVLFFNESLGIYKFLGVTLIMIGIIITSKG